VCTILSHRVGKSRETLTEVERGRKTVRAQHARKRGHFMLLFAITFGFAQLILNVVAVVQFLWLLFANEPNRFLLRFRSLSTRLADVARFLTCASDEKPFPSGPGQMLAEPTGASRPLFTTGGAAGAPVSRGRLLRGVSPPHARP
jgi:hypothetical protein